MKLLYSILVPLLACGSAVAQETVFTADINETLAPAESFFTYLPIPADEIAAAIGVSPAEAQVGSFDADGKLTTDTTTPNGFFFNAEGVPCAWGEGEVIFAKYDDGMVVGSDYNEFALDDTYSFRFAFINNDKAAVLNINLTFGEIDYEVLWEEPLYLNIEMGEPDYKAHPLAIDVARVEASLGTTIASAIPVALQPDGTFSTDQTANNGFWFSGEGYVTYWGDNSVMFAEFYDDAINVGMFPGAAEEGDSFTANFGFAAGSRVVVFNLNVEMAEAREHNYEVVWEKALDLKMDLNTEYETMTVAIGAEVAEALGCNPVTAAVVALNPDKTFVGNPTAVNGFWYDAEGYVCGWGEGAACFVECHEDEAADYGILAIGQFPEGLEIADTVKVDFGFANNDDKVALYHITLTITDPMSVDSVATDSESFSIFNLQGVCVRTSASGISEAALPAGIYIANGRKIVVK